MAKQGEWTKEDQQKAAQRGQGAEIGATHGGDAPAGQAQQNWPDNPAEQGELPFAGNKPRQPGRGRR